MSWCLSSGRVWRRSPKRERPWAQLMLALYRSGRQAEALATYREARAILADAFGLEAGAELRRLERLILLQERTLEHDAVGRMQGVPRPATSLVGRERDLAKLREVMQHSARLPRGPGRRGQDAARHQVAAGVRSRFPMASGGST